MLALALLLVAQDHGPRPGPGAIEIVDRGVRSELLDPYSAVTDWPHGFVSGWYKKPFGRKVYGWITCGTINAKNPYGAFTGEQTVLAVVNNGRVVLVDMDSPNFSSAGVATVTCRKLGIPVG